MAPQHIVVADPAAKQRRRMSALVTRAASELSTTIEVHEVEDGLEAHRLIETHHPALVLGEILLPRLSGLQLIRRLRESWQEDTLPRFIFVTSMGRESDRYWALRNGAHAYVIKPYEDEVLFARIRQVLATGRSATPEKLGPI
ncbi:MAG TPA: response regulator [Nannocystis exedens]|nr:response regulator [Nannocystis exedens]